MKKRSYPVLCIFVMISLFLQVFPVCGQSGFPFFFDLRDQNLVSRVKSQWPWGSCWAFGAAAAAEISILSQLREISPEYAEYYADPDNLDISELQLSWFAYTRLPDFDHDDPHSQAGEGAAVLNMYRLGAGGYTSMMDTSFANGIGPIPEALAPYKAWDAGIDYELLDTLNEIELSDEDVWYVPEYLRFVSEFELLEARELPYFWTEEGEDNYVFHPEAIDAVKAELMANRGVAVSYCADTTFGDDESEGYEFLNRETYAHYIPMPMGSNHVVCIVGWDDHYPRENFNPMYQPPADGAWIAKNSWGIRTDPEDAESGWGINGSGYFYLSYYDQSLSTPSSYIFDVRSDRSSVQSVFKVIDQYDLFNGGIWTESAGEFGIEKMGVSNVFTACYDQYLKAVSLYTPKAGQAVTLKIIKLKPGWETPEDGEVFCSRDLRFPYAGWHRLQLDEELFLTGGDEYSLVMYIDSIGVEEMQINLLDEEDPDYEKEDDKVVVINEKDSFFMFNDRGEWMDWSEMSHYMGETKYAEDGPYIITYYDNPGLKAYAEPAVNLTASLEGYLSDQGWTEGAEMYFRVVIGNPDGADFGSLVIMSALSGFADPIVFDEVPAGGTAEADYTYYLTEADVEAGTVTEYITIQPLTAPRLVGPVLRLTVFDQ